MTNEVYNTTHSELTDLVSARVASRILDKVLRKEKLNPETVTPEQMKTLLGGSLLDELTGILPRAGLKRSLQSLSRSFATAASPDTESSEQHVPPDSSEHQESEHQEAELEADTSGSGDAKSSEPPEAAKTDAAPAFTFEDHAPAEPSAPEPSAKNGSANDVLEPLAAVLDGDALRPVASLESDQAENNTATAQPSRAEAAAGERGSDLKPELETAPEPTGVAQVKTATTAPVATAAQAAAKVLSEAELEKAVLSFAHLDHIKMVAALSESGEVSLSRGGGFDLATLSRIGVVGLKLLARSGHLRAYYLAFSGGQLFLFPLESHTLCIIGTAELNLGLAFSTLHKLKEEM